MNIKERLLKRCEELNKDSNFPEFWVTPADAAILAEALVAELAKENKPVARICSGWQLLFIGSDSIAEVARKHSLKIGDALYPLPPTAEQIEQETAEACARVYLNTYDLTDIADDIRSGAWKEFKKS